MLIYKITLQNRVLAAGYLRKQSVDSQVRQSATNSEAGPPILFSSIGLSLVFARLDQLCTLCAIRKCMRLSQSMMTMC